MLNLLNALDSQSLGFWLLVVLGILIAILCIVVITLFSVTIVHSRKTAAEPRHLVGIDLDMMLVKREYAVGEQFDPSGLIVKANYSGEPFETIFDKFAKVTPDLLEDLFKDDKKLKELESRLILVTPELLHELARLNKKPEDLGGCHIYVPDLSVCGKPAVTVTYKDQSTAYAVSVIAPGMVNNTVTVGAPENVNYTVTVEAPEELNALQVALFNGNNRICEAVNVENRVAVISAPVGEYIIKVYGLPDADFVVTTELLSAEKRTANIKIEYCEDYYLANNKKPEVKEVIPEEPAVVEVEPVVEELAVAEAPAEPVAIAEESFLGGTLRYDRSFTARLIQSDNEVKEWYTEIKNDLLSYKKVHDRMSWKRESYNYGRLSFAKLAYRGETLCLYLPLDPESFADSKYKVESVLDSTSYKDTPCLYRIKNQRRAKYAKELIELAAQQMEIPKIERESQDYFLPYEGVVELINKGLIKRNIKSAEDEAFFNSNKAEE